MAATAVKSASTAEIFMREVAWCVKNELKDVASFIMTLLTRQCRGREAFQLGNN